MPVGVSLPWNILAFGLLVAACVIELLFVRANDDRESNVTQHNKYLVALVVIFTVKELVAVYVMYEARPYRFFQSIVMSGLLGFFAYRYLRTQPGRNNGFMPVFYMLFVITALATIDQALNLMHLSMGGSRPLQTY